MADKLKSLQLGEKKRMNKSKVGRALISVSDKSGVVDFAKGLIDLGVEIVSTGGTFQALKEADERREKDG